LDVAFARKISVIISARLTSRTGGRNSSFCTTLPSRPAVVYPEAIDKAKAELAQAKLDKDKVKIQEQTSELARLKGELKRWRALHRRQLLLDLLSEEDASADQARVIAFHRFQIVVWTLILGVVFVFEVLTKLAMPVFDTTLLTLVGISSGTYLGFKASAK
jgi:hypothetical protein